MPKNSSLNALLENLNSLLRAQGISRAELARRARMPQTTVNRVFNALEDRISPTLETLEGLSRGFRVPLASLLSGAPLPASSTPQDSPRSLSRQLARLTEDFLLSDADGRAEILRKADECATLAQDGRGEAAV